MRKRTAMSYMEDLYEALMFNFANLSELYAGREGALKLAREFGYGLADFPKKEQKDIIGSSYGHLCVRFYQLQPPVDAGDWFKAIERGIKEIEDDRI